MPETLERLERLRQKLLDLTTSNRMLSYRHPAASCLRVVDELASVLFQQLMDGQSMTFEPIPEPTRRELDFWASNANSVPRAGEEKDAKRPCSALPFAAECGINSTLDVM